MSISGTAASDSRAQQSVALSDGSEIELLRVPKAVKMLKTEAQQLRDQLARLPRLEAPLQLDAYGYHGGYLPALDQLPTSPRWTVDVHYKSYAHLTQIMLIPAIDHRFDHLRSYGFPRRFRISQVFKDGRTQPFGEWLDEDYPVPGRTPVIIDLPPKKSNVIRIEVFRGSIEGDLETFALDEVLGVVSREIADPSKVIVSSEYTAKPYWNKDYLIDQKTSLGLPTGPSSNKGAAPQAEDFKVVFDSVHKRSCSVELDLGRNRKIGWMTLFPALPTEGIMIPGYGFPRDITVEFMPDTEVEGTRGGRKPNNPYTIKAENPGNNVLHLPGYEDVARWIRLTFKQLPVHNGRQTFAMGEIHVLRLEESFPIKSVRLEGFPSNADADAPLLIDQKSAGRPIMPLVDWLHQIQHRHSLEMELANYTERIETLEARWDRWIKWIAYGTVICIILIAISVAVSQTVHRKRHTKKLRQQISSDLHDDIGSNIAAIGLASSRMEHNAPTNLVQKESTRIRLIANEMNGILRDVIWLTDSRTDTLDQVIQKLANTAQTIVSPHCLKLEVTPLTQLTNYPINVQMKRDLLLFFKEALHNAAQHSGAEAIEVCIQQENKKLTLRIQDNGSGFDLPTDKDQFYAANHHGLHTMQLRSKRLHAQLSIDSELNTGTRVELKMKLR